MTAPFLHRIHVLKKRYMYNYKIFIHVICMKAVKFLMSPKYCCPKFMGQTIYYFWGRVSRVSMSSEIELFLAQNSPQTFYDHFLICSEGKCR